MHEALSHGKMPSCSVNQMPTCKLTMAAMAAMRRGTLQTGEKSNRGAPISMPSVRKVSALSRSGNCSSAVPSGVASSWMLRA